MKKRAMTLGLALFCAFLLCGCRKTTPQAPVQEAAGRAALILRGWLLRAYPEIGKTG